MWRILQKSGSVKFVKRLVNFNCVIVQGVPLATEPGIEDIASKFEKEYVRCVGKEEECFCSVCL
jgi:hypothetical protein